MMALSDLTVRQAKAADKTYSLPDTDGLGLVVAPTGGKSWHLRYYWLGKQKRISLGNYPEIGLREARTLRDEARPLLAKGINPHTVRKQKRHAVKLAAETAAGKDPRETVKEMSRICEAAEEAEDVKLDADFTGLSFTRIDQAIAMGALFTAHHLGAKAIVAMTDSGATALWMSRQRIHVPIFALTPKIATQRKLALYRNVRPILMDTSADRDTALAQAEAHLKSRGIVQSGDVYAITCGEPMGAPGGSNMLKICRAV